MCSVEVLQDDEVNVERRRPRQASFVYLEWLFQWQKGGPWTRERLTTSLNEQWHKVTLVFEFRTRVFRGRNVERRTWMEKEWIGSNGGQGEVLFPDSSTFRKWKETAVFFPPSFTHTLLQRTSASGGPATSCRSWWEQNGETIKLLIEGVELLSRWPSSDGERLSFIYSHQGTQMCVSFPGVNK